MNIKMSSLLTITLFGLGATLGVAQAALPVNLNCELHTSYGSVGLPSLGIPGGNTNNPIKAFEGDDQGYHFEAWALPFETPDSLFLQLNLRDGEGHSAISQGVLVTDGKSRSALAVVLDTTSSVKPSLRCEIIPQ